MAQTAYGPTRIIGPAGLTNEFAGVAGGSGTSTVVTLPIPPNAIILGVLVSSCTSATGAFCATISTNTFTVTTASNDLFSYRAHVKGI